MPGIFFTRMDGGKMKIRILKNHAVNSGECTREY